MIMKYKINTKIKTEHGDGIIIGYDLPESQKSTRYIVKLDDTKRFNFNPCYNEKEIKNGDND